MPTGVYERKLIGPRAARVIIACESCGKERTYLESRLRSRKTIKYCSYVCMGVGARKPGTHVVASCSTCGKNFKKRKDHVWELNYCSLACTSAARRVDGAKWRDPNKIKEYMQAYLAKNRDRANERAREWSKKNPEKKRESGRKRRLISAQRDKLERAAYIALLGGQCLKCGTTERLEIDHVVALSRGGQDTGDNHQILCRGCNASKGAKTIDYRRKGAARAA